MSTKIPSSLKWLIDKRARLEAEIRKTEVSLSKAQELIEELSNLKGSLSAIDHALGLHEIKIDVNFIQPINSKYVRINLPHGELTRSILLCLRLNDERPLGMSEITNFIAARFGDLAALPEKRSRLSRSVHDRLKNLARSGIIKRHHPLDCNKDGLWSLAKTRE